jgi:hypothetical protein
MLCAVWIMMDFLKFNPTTWFEMPCLVSALYYTNQQTGTLLESTLKELRPIFDRHYSMPRVDVVKVVSGV